MTFSIYIISFILVFLVALRSYCSSGSKNPPPSPPKWPIIGNLHQLSPRVHLSFFSLSERYGRDLMLLYLGSIPSLVVSTAEGARAIFQTHDLKFTSRPTFKALKKVSYDYREIGMAPYGDYWREAKKLLTLQCLTQKQVQAFGKVRDEEIAIALDRIVKHSTRKEVVNLSDLFSRHSNDVTTRVTFGRKYSEGEIGDKFKKVVEDLDEALGHFYFVDTIPWLGWVDRVTGSRRRCDDAWKSFDAFLEAAIVERLAKLNSQGTKHQTDSQSFEDDAQPPFIDVLLRHQNNDEDTFTLNRDGVKALLVDMYFGGANATISAMEWTMVELLRHPNVLKKLQLEIRAIVNDKQHIGTDELEKMEYLRAVIMEATRLHPPAPVVMPRITAEDTKVMGFDVAKGTRIYVNAWAVGRDPKAWDRPYDFMPERFIGESINYVNHEFKLITFGGGRRMCPGRLFGMAIVENLIANVLWKFDLTLPDGMKPDDINITERERFITLLEVPLLAFATPVS